MGEGYVKKTCQKDKYRWQTVVCQANLRHPKMPPAHNTRLPAPVAALLSPNPWPVTLFAEGRKQCAGPAGSATWGRYMQCTKNMGGHPWPPNRSQH
jgi:hypothetical protein